MAMDEDKFLRLKILERTEDALDAIVEEKSPIHFSHPNQTNPFKKAEINPVYKNMLKFHNEKIGEKFSVKDLLR